MKCWNSTFNAQGSRGIIVVVQVGAVKIYVAAEALRKKERGDETQFTTEIDGLTSLGPQLFRFVKFLFSVTCLMPCYLEIGRFRPLKSQDFTDISIIIIYFSSSTLCAMNYHIEALASIKVHNYKHIITILMRNTHSIITHLVKWGSMPYIKSSTKTCKIES
jgi:hypothetical protein